MNRLVFRLLLTISIIISFIVGYAFYHYSITIWDPVYRGLEKTNSEVEKLRQEAILFFYRTMKELFEGNYDPNDSYVYKYALNTFNEYKSRLEPRCRLINIYFYDAALVSEVLFPSGERFEVDMRKTDKGWLLYSIDHLSSEQIYRDLKLDNKSDIKTNANKPRGT